MSLAETRERIRQRSLTPQQLAEQALQRANSNASHNVYLQLDTASVMAEARPLEHLDSAAYGPLFGIPISIKDCFDVEGYRTSCGSAFYNANDPIAPADSWIAKRLRASGAIITGKTHLHQLAYGITGENEDFGDCLQPRDAALLTGGSSSGAAASVQEGSAMIAIGTDTGGSIRVPAALCGLAGYRASVGVGSWQGGTHLAPTFDTLGFLFKDLQDAPTIAQALFDIVPATAVPITPRIAVVGSAFLNDCEDTVLQIYKLRQQQILGLGASLHEIDTTFWQDAVDIFSTIQAHEAAALQRRKLSNRADLSVFEPAIAARLTWGESLPPLQLADYRQRHLIFRAAMDAILSQYDFLLMPCLPLGSLQASADHTETRSRILRYTTPVSLAGMPAVTIPHVGGAGIQLAAALGQDATLLSFAAHLQHHLNGMEND